MSGAYRDPIFRAITIIALIQCGVVVGGTMFVSVMARLFAFNSADVPVHALSPLTRCFRYSGFWLLAFPIAWTIVSSILVRGLNGFLPRMAVLIFGVGAAIFGIAAYIVVAFGQGYL